MLSAMGLRRVGHDLVTEQQKDLWQCNILPASQKPKGIVY